MMHRQRVILLLITLIIPFLTSCYDAKELDEWAYVYTMGIDKGVSDNLRITLQIETMREQQSNGPGSKEQNDFTVITLDCPSFYSGVNMINTSLSRKLNYMHAKYFVISEALAKEDISGLMSAFVRDRQIRRIMHMVVVRGTAQAIYRGH